MTAQDHIFELLMEKIKLDQEYSSFDSDAMRRGIFVGTNRPSHPNSGKQITRFGLNILKQHFKFWQGEVTTPEFSKYKTLKIDKCLHGAWYLDETTFIVFTPSDFTLFALSGGDMNIFFDLIYN